MCEVLCVVNVKKVVWQFVKGLNSRVRLIYDYVQ